VDTIDTADRAETVETSDTSNHLPSKPLSEILATSMLEFGGISQLAEYGSMSPEYRSMGCFPDTFIFIHSPTDQADI